MCLQEYPVDAGFSQGSILCSILVLPNINDVHVTCIIAINADNATRCSTFELVSGL